LNASAGEGFNAGTGVSASNAITVGELDVDVDELEDERALAVNSAIAVEKEIAADTLGLVFAAVGEPFLPYLETATRELIRLLDHYYEGIRKSACSSLLEFLHAFYVLSNPEQWQPGIPLVRPADCCGDLRE
jgi:importin-4